MTFNKACSMSTVGVAVRLSDDDEIRGWVWVPRRDPTKFLVTDDPPDYPLGCRRVDLNYAGVYKDWHAWKPIDPITLLGDLVRVVLCAA